MFLSAKFTDSRDTTSLQTHCESGQTYGMLDLLRDCFVNHVLDEQKLHDPGPLGFGATRLLWCDAFVCRSGLGSYKNVGMPWRHYSESSLSQEL